MRILFCQLKSYGDIIRTFKTIEAIKKAYPNTFLAATCLEGMDKAMKMCKDLDVVITQKKLTKGTETRLLDCTALEESISEARKLKFDYYIDFNGVYQSALFGLLAGIDRRIGPNKPAGKDGSYLFYTDPIDIQCKEINRMNRHFDLCKTIFKNICLESSTQINKNGSILIAPGTSEIGVYKRWNAEGYAYLIENILKSIDKSIQIIVHKDEVQIAESILSKLDKEDCKLIEIEDFEDAFDIIKKCICIISTDSAFAHIATVNNIPTFMILGPTSVTENAPWDKVISSFVVNKKKCSPCNLWVRKCTHNNSCMKELHETYVYEKFMKFYKRINHKGEVK